MSVNLLLSLLRSYAAFRLTYRDDPEAFVYDCFYWKPNERPASYQTGRLVDLLKFGRVAERGPRGLGKTTTAAWAILWFALTRDIDVDWKIGTTASSWRQLTHYLWPEVHKWAKRLRWDKIGREPFSKYELLSLGIKLKTGHAYAAASTDPETLEGGHADSFLYIFDEAKIIPEPVWDAIEGVFMNPGEGYWLAISTPGPPAGVFYKIHKRMPGFEDWKAVKVTKEEALKEGRITEDAVKRLIRRWGKGSSQYKMQVEGEFAEESANNVVYLDWVERSQELWREYTKNGTEFKGRIVGLGVDTAGDGKDPDNTIITVLMSKYLVKEFIRLESKLPMEIVGYIVKLLDKVRGKKSIPIYIDIIGAGGLGVYSRLKELGYNAIGITGSERSDGTDETGQFEFVNKRAEDLWRVRDLLNPDYGYDLKIPPVEEIVQDLVVPKFKLNSNGRILIQPKEEIKEILGRSPDWGDSLMYGCNCYVKKKLEVGLV